MREKIEDITQVDLNKKFDKFEVLFVSMDVFRDILFVLFVFNIFDNYEKNSAHVNFCYMRMIINNNILEEQSRIISIDIDTLPNLGYNEDIITRNSNKKNI